MVMPEFESNTGRHDRTKRPAGLGPRFLARLIDSVVVAVILYLVMSIFGLQENLPLLAGLAAAAALVYFIVCETQWGTTIGKRLLGLRVIDPAGTRPSARQSVRRNVFIAVGALPYIGTILDLALRIAIAVTIAKSPTKQGIHDRWADGTQVVHNS